MIILINGMGGFDSQCSPQYCGCYSTYTGACSHCDYTSGCSDCGDCTDCPNVMPW